MSQQEMNILFKVINFIRTEKYREYCLNSTDSLLLVLLAAHGAYRNSKGIFPGQDCLALECNVSVRYVRLRLAHLQKLGLISYKKIGRKYHYTLHFLSTIPEQEFPYETVDNLKQRNSSSSIQRNSSSGNSGTLVPTNNINKKTIKKTESARAKRAPLSDSWLPNEKLTAKAYEVAEKVNLTPEHLLTKFKNIQKSKDGTSADWNCEYENFLINERVPSVWGDKKKVEEPRRPTGIDFTQERLEREVHDRLKQEANPVDYVPSGISFRERKRMYEETKGVLPNGHISGNNGRGKNSD